MKENIINLVGDKLNSLNVFIDEVYESVEDGNKYLHIVLDSDVIIPLNTVVMATRIINPLLDKENIIEGSYILDIYAKEKGDVNNE